MRIGNSGTEHIITVSEGVDRLIADSILKRILEEGKCAWWGFEDLYDGEKYNSFKKVFDELCNKHHCIYKKGDFYHLTPLGDEVARKGIRKYNRDWKIKNVYFKWLVYIAVPLLATLIAAGVQIYIHCNDK